jgi:hypothetical protein
MTRPIKLTIKTIYALLFCIAWGATAQAQNWSGTLAASRATDWTKAGLPATLPDGETTPNRWTPPTRTTICTTISTASFPGMSSGNYVAPTAINNALAACGQGHVVYVNAGTYYFSGSITLGNQNGVTLRMNDGAKLIFNAAPAVTWYNGAGAIFQNANWTASSYTAGTNQLTLPSVTGLTIGYSELDMHQCNDGVSGGNGNCNVGTETDPGGLWVCGTTAPCSGQGITYNCNGSGGKCDQVQISLVTGCDGVATVGHSCTNASQPVTISPGLLMPNWSPARSPIAAGLNPAWGDGIEGGTIDITQAAGTGLLLEFSYAAWIYDCRILGGSGGTGFIQTAQSANYLFANDYFYQRVYLTEGAQEMIVLEEDTGALVLNNIWQGGPITYTQAGSVGDVFAYNVNRDGIGGSTYDFYGNLWVAHNPGNSLALFEGNEIGAWQDDSIHGSHNLNTLFRNLLYGDPPYIKTNTKNRMIDAQGVSRGDSAIGNVMGDPENTCYQITANAWSDCSASFEIGASNGSPTYPYDPTTVAMFYRWANWDYVTGAARYCGPSDPNFANPPCNNVSEVPTSLSGAAAPFDQATPASHTLPPSFFLPTTAHSNGGTGLSWWKVCTNFPTCSTTQTQPFPPVGPDVTGGSIYLQEISYAGHAYDIPASVAWRTLPIDPSYQRSYTITSSTWAAGTETLIISSPGGYGAYGEFQISGGPCAGTYYVTNATAGSVNFALATNPGVNACSSGTFLWPDVRQFGSTVYQSDGGGSVGPTLPAAPTNLTAVVH